MIKELKLKSSKKCFKIFKKIPIIILYLWYFQNINPNDDLTQYINLLARYAFVMGISLAKDFNRECVSANLAKMRNTFEFSKDFETFFQK